MTTFIPIEVLLVEDSPGDVRLLQEALRDAGPGAHLHVVTDGAEAAAFLSRQGVHDKSPRPRLILLDLNRHPAHLRRPDRKQQIDS